MDAGRRDTALTHPPENEKAGESGVLFLCPFDLSRYRGTALRARMTIDALRTAISCGVICRGDDGRGSVVLGGSGGGTGLSAYLHEMQFSLRALPYMRQMGARAVHTFDAVSALPAVLWWKPRQRGSIVVELHGLVSAQMGRGGPVVHSLVRALERLVLRRADRIIAMSYSQRDFLVRVFKLPPEKIEVIWGPVDLGVFRYCDPEEAETFRVGYSGNDFPWQGVDDCIEAAKLLAHNNALEFVFLTGSGWRTALERLGRVRGIPVTTRTEAADWLGRCDALLSPRKGRAADLQYPFKLSSYLAVGRPVIATDVSDQRRILEEARCGLVVPPGSPQAIAGAVMRLKGEAPEARVEMGRRARRFAEEHLSLAQFRATLTSMYRELGI